MLDPELELRNNHTFLPSYGFNGRIDVAKLLMEIRQSAINTFDRLDSDGNGFISIAELETSLNDPSLLVREISYIYFHICNFEKIACAVPASDSASASGTSRSDLVSLLGKH